MNRRVLLGLTIGLLTSLSLAAQTADELVEKNVQARGGREKLKSVQTLRITGKLVGGPTETPLVEERARPTKLRRDFNVRGLNGTQAYDGVKGWQVMGPTGARVVSGDDLKDFMDDADIDGPLMDYKSKGNKVEYLGKADLDGKSAYKLKLTQKSGNVSTLYLDASTYLVVKGEAKRVLQGRELEVDEVLGDYKKGDEGLTFPYSMEQRVEGQGGQTFKIDKIEINPKLDSAIFAMPKAAAAPAH
jgi:hypothetical protein